MTLLFRNIVIRVRGRLFPSTMTTDPLIKSLLLVMGLLFMAQLGIILYYFNRFPELIIIRSNIFFGIDLVGARKYSFAIPIGALILSLLHTALASVLYRQHKELAKIVLVGTLVVLLLLFVNIFLLINLNI